MALLCTAFCVSIVLSTTTSQFTIVGGSNVLSRMKSKIVSKNQYLHENVIHRNYFDKVESIIYFIMKDIVMDRTPFYKTSNKLEYKF